MPGKARSISVDLGLATPDAANLAEGWTLNAGVYGSAISGFLPRILSLV
ncbi:MAG: hypothetical protein ACKVJG_26830 [Candidatus Latescibacterota bacterium]